jgi:predicted MFS family arabinose efflux permease
VIIWSNVVLAVLFPIVARSSLGAGLVLGIAALSIAAAARQAPLHALTTEIVPPEVRGEYVALRNAASQLGIAAVATASATAFDAGGFDAVSWIAAIATLAIPLCCVWLKYPYDSIFLSSNWVPQLAQNASVGRMAVLHCGHVGLKLYRQCGQ